MGMREPWIRNCGTAEEKDVPQLLLAWQKEHEDCKTLMFYTDRFVPVLSANPDYGHLLEARLFTKDAELWLHRTCIGLLFAWRTADDDVLAQQVKQRKPDFFANPENYRLISEQKLDIDLQASPKGSGPEGCKLLQTTGGRTYALPISDENAVRLVVYLDYDAKGVCRQKDFRYAGFIRKECFGEAKNSV